MPPTDPKAIDYDDECAKLAKSFKGGPFVPYQAMVALGKTLPETIVILEALEAGGYCGCPVNDGGRKLFCVVPDKV